MFNLHTYSSRSRAERRAFRRFLKQVDRELVVLSRNIERFKKKVQSSRKAFKNTYGPLTLPEKHQPPSTVQRKEEHYKKRGGKRSAQSGKRSAINSFIQGVLNPPIVGNIEDKEELVTQEESKEIEDVIEQWIENEEKALQEIEEKLPLGRIEEEDIEEQDKEEPVAQEEAKEMEKAVEQWIEDEEKAWQEIREKLTLGKDEEEESDQAEDIEQDEEEPLIQEEAKIENVDERWVQTEEKALQEIREKLTLGKVEKGDAEQKRENKGGQTDQSSFQNASTLSSDPKRTARTRVSKEPVVTATHLAYLAAFCELRDKIHIKLKFIEGYNEQVTRLLTIAERTLRGKLNVMRNHHYSLARSLKEMKARYCPYFADVKASLMPEKSEGGKKKMERKEKKEKRGEDNTGRRKGKQ